MATIKYWIQLENRPWDASPHNINRITGQDIKKVTGKDPIDVTLKSPGTGVTKTRKMFNPLRVDGNVIDALILRRYKPPTKDDESDAWTVPDDRKVNPWDLNELDPTDNGTMGTIPGPVIECNVGDEVQVHFRNMDMRTHVVTTEMCVPVGPPPVPPFCFPVFTEEPMEIEKRVHSLHPHGFVFAATSDGAYPLSPPDSTQPVKGLLGDESMVWSKVPGFKGTLKQGDRVPPGGTFIYAWNTITWPTTAGVWLYHDHSICDMENVNLGAIGIIAIHNPADTAQEVDIRDPIDPAMLALDPAFLPGGSPNGDPREFVCFDFPPGGPRPLPVPVREIRVLPHDLEGLGAHDEIPHGHGMAATAQSSPGEPASPILARTIRRGDMLLQLDEKLQIINRLCMNVYRTPPAKALYLQLFHTLTGGLSTDGGLAMMINGRTFLGNTPTMVAGPNTRMRFGVVGMGDDFHTFHIHGHRWIIPGPDGITPTDIQKSPMVRAVSQFEDTKIFGPANSFVFTIEEGSGFMRASPPIGEWHMHCHVLRHMMMGMMGSLLVVNGGDLASALPVGVPCDMPKMGGGGGGGATPHLVEIKNAGDDGFVDKVTVSKVTNIKVNDTVTWKNMDNQAHTASKTSGPLPNFDSGNILAGATSAPVIFTTAGTINYRCNIHTNMTGTIQVT